MPELAFTQAWSRQQKRKQKQVAILSTKNNVRYESEQMLLYITQKTKIVQAKHIKQELSTLGY